MQLVLVQGSDPTRENSNSEKKGWKETYKYLYMYKQQKEQEKGAKLPRGLLLLKGRLVAPTQ